MEVLSAAFRIASAPARGKITAPRFASASREVVMHKARTTCIPLIEQDRPDRSIGMGKGASSSLDERLSHLMILLRQLEKSVPGLVSIPEIELSEIVYSAVRLCGFVDPVEAEYAIEAVLEALEARSSSLGKSSGECEPRPPGVTFPSDN
jgi:hypothetical protein